MALELDDTVLLVPCAVRPNIVRTAEIAHLVLGERFLQQPRAEVQAEVERRFQIAIPQQTPTAENFANLRGLL